MPLCSHYRQQGQIDWQSAFIKDNSLMIGYLAWVGFQQMGAGALRCNVQLPPIEAELWFHNWKFTADFLTKQRLADYLQTLNISSITSLTTASEEYKPQQEIMLIIQAGDLVEIVVLKSRVTSPPAAYQLVLDRWDEFVTNDDLPFITSSSLQISLPDASLEVFTEWAEDSQIVRETNLQCPSPLKEWLNILAWLMPWGLRGNC